MVLFNHEIRRAKKTWIIWTLSISILMAICVFIYKDLKPQMESMSELFSSMGALGAAFGMSKINLGTFIGFYALECGNMLGLGGALFAAIIGISSLAKEETDGTAEFLLTHPIGRIRYAAEKLAAVVLQVVALNLAVFIVTALSTAAIGEDAFSPKFLLVHYMFLLLHLQIAAMSVGLSALIKNAGLGIGIGTTIILYFLNIIANMTEKAKFLEYFTPFAYAEGAEVISSGVNRLYLTLGALCAVALLSAGFWIFRKKDIA